MSVENVDIKALLAEVSTEVQKLLKTQPEGTDLNKADLSRPGKELNADSAQPSNKTKPISESRPGKELNSDSPGNAKGKSVEKGEESSSSSSSSSVAKREESSSSSSSASMKKDDESSSGSGYESQAPEASASASSPAADPSASAPAPSESAPAAGAELESIESQLQQLDDDMLQELSQKVKAEMEARMASASGSAAAPQGSPAAPGAPAQAPAPAMAMAMAEKEVGEKLAKAEERMTKAEKENEELKKALGDMTAIVSHMINRPKVRAANSITDVQFVDRGEEALKKAEVEKMSKEDITKKLKDVTSDNKKLATFSKKEHDAILDFYATGKRSPELLKVIQ